MNAKEKAQELVDKYYQLCADSSSPEWMAKQCALIAVDEIMIYVQMPTKVPYLYSIDYWQQVKKEIEKL